MWRDRWWSWVLKVEEEDFVVKIEMMKMERMMLKIVMVLW